MRFEGFRFFCFIAKTLCSHSDWLSEYNIQDYKIIDILVRRGRKIIYGSAEELLARTKLFGRYSFLHPSVSIVLDNLAVVQL